MSGKLSRLSQQFWDSQETCGYSHFRNFWEPIKKFQEWSKKCPYSLEIFQTRQKLWDHPEPFIFYGTFCTLSRNFPNFQKTLRLSGKFLNIRNLSKLSGNIHFSEAFQTVLKPYRLSGSFPSCFETIILKLSRSPLITTNAGWKMV